MQGMKDDQIPSGRELLHFDFKLSTFARYSQRVRVMNVPDRVHEPRVQFHYSKTLQNVLRLLQSRAANFTGCKLQCPMRNDRTVTKDE